MSGDTVNLSVQCYYVSPGGGSTNNSSFSDVLNSLSNGLVNLTGGAHGTLSNLTSSGSTVYNGLSSFLSGDDTAHSGYPKAYLNWIFLDDQFNYVSSLSGSVLAASATYAPGSMNLVAPGGPISLNRSGYLYIWVSNETTGWDVYYDNLSIQYKQGPLLEESHYYPFGLTMAGISDKAVKTNYAENKYRYNSGTELQNKEFSDGTGLEYYDAGFRRLDPQLGRFAQVDPLADRSQFNSAYSFANDNPVLLNDPSGLEASANSCAFIGHFGDFWTNTINNLMEGGPGSYWQNNADGTNSYYFADGDDDDDDWGGGCPIAGPGDPGHLGGNVHVTTAVSTGLITGKDGSLELAYGEAFVADVNLTGFNFAAYNWIQSITSPEPVTFGLTTLSSEYLDGDRDKTTGQLIAPPLYYTSVQAADPADIETDANGNLTAIFHDNPSTTSDPKTWNALATLVGISKDGQLTPILSISWGYQVTPANSPTTANPSLANVSIMQPALSNISSFLQNIINEYNAGLGNIISMYMSTPHY
jgi:RHS repeat-associated protein